MSFPPGTEMFQFPGFASMPYEFRQGSPCGGVSPFGHPRINDRSHLPAAFRSVPRPSSPLGAKASTERPYRAHPPPAPARRTKPHMRLPMASKNAQQYSLTLTQPIRFTCQTTRPQPSPGHHSPSRASGKPVVQRQPRETHRRTATRPRQHVQTMETVGFEPTTPCLQSRCSPTELRPLTGPQPGGPGRT